MVMMMGTGKTRGKMLDGLSLKNLSNEQEAGGPHGLRRLRGLSRQIVLAHQDLAARRSSNCCGSDCYGPTQKDCHGDGLERKEGHS